MSNASDVDAIERSLTRLNPEMLVVRTLFRPKPLASLDGKRVIFVTTAPRAICETLESHLERHYRCEIVGLSHNLSNRPVLRKELSELLDRYAVDAVVTELKAGAVDVVTAMAIDRGIEVVYTDNVPIWVGGCDLDRSVLAVVRSIMERFRRGSERGG